MRRSIALIFVVFMIGCSSTPPVEDTVITKPLPKAPECLPGCAPNIDDACVTIANVSDGAMAETQEVECAPECCDPTARVTSGDKDADGVIDDKDECPDEPEDIDEFQDGDGCPDLDNDGDKIPDVDDLCALDAEDFDGFQDDDGCPD